MNRNRRQALFLAINSGAALIITLNAIEALSTILPSKIWQASSSQLLLAVLPLLALEFGLFLLGLFRFIHRSQFD